MALVMAGCAQKAPTEASETGRTGELATRTDKLVPSPGKRSYMNFESGPVRPMALSPDGSKLFVTNIPDGQLEIFAVDAQGGLTRSGSVPVGMEPVAVAARSNAEVWVVNHLSDSVSVVDVASNPARVTRTLLVGDEPRDVLFAGAGNARAFVTTAHRGQNRNLVAANLFTTGTQDAQLFTPSVPRADVWIYDAANLGTGLGGTPLKVMELYGDTPRPLAASPDGNTVYAGVHFSGNRTSTISATAVCDGFNPNAPCTLNGVTYPGGDFGPSSNDAGVHAPDVGLIVKFNPTSGHWEDQIGRNWDNAVRFSLPDKDVFAINVSTLTEVNNFKGVGTTLFNMVTNPVSGKLYVSNFESSNLRRFEGPGVHGGQTVQGHLAEARISVIDPVSGVVSPRHLNKHINYAQLDAPASTKASSLSMPLQMAVTSNGQTLYVAAFGSSKVGVYSTAALENNSFDPATVAPAHINVPGGGPAGIVLSESKGKLYVMTRFDNAVSVINLSTKAETQHLTMWNPEPAKVTAGRRFLYDAVESSSNGEASCASCHIFGDTDQLAWDLGNPDGDVTVTKLPIHLENATTPLGQLDPTIAADIAAVVPVLNGTGKVRELHPMKGPMATQTLRGMQNHGPMHWRGDRVDGFFGADPTSENGPPFDARHSFKNFIVAFDGLIGKETDLEIAKMEQFADFALELFLPPNPIRNLDNSLTSAQEAGRQYYFGCTGLDTALFLPVVCNEGNDGPGGLLQPMTKGHGAAGTPLLAQYETCNSCHAQDPLKGYFGTDGQMAFDQVTQTIKVPHFRNAYTKVGMFGQHLSPLQNQVPDLGVFQGDQIRGFGFQSNGAMDQLFHFFNGRQFNGRYGNAVGFANDQQRRDVISFVMAAPTDLAPVVGQQVTLTSSNAAVAGPRIDLLIARAAASFHSKELGGSTKECELTVRGIVGGKRRGYLYRPSANGFEPDDGTGNLTDASLRALAATGGQQLTYTCVPPGQGVRVALDRDNDGLANLVDYCPEDASNKCQTCSGTQMDCNNDNVPCLSFTDTNLNHYNAGRATRDRDCLLIICGAWKYYAVGSGESLGGDSTSKTLYSRTGSSWSTTSCVGNGCESNGASDVNNCGACGNVCAFPHAGATCAASACQMQLCDAGYVNCNGSLSDGCEANLQNDAANCGACGRSCAVGQACVAGNCQCAAGRADCDGVAATGCEANLTSEVLHCGSCTHVCNFPNAGTDCQASSCTMGACSQGYGNCNNSASDGCEKNLNADPNNCGSCGRVCPSGPNAQSGCDGQGVCSFVCNPGFSDCNGNTADGCERTGPCMAINKQKVAPGHDFTCAITSGGGVACWGANDKGQLGRGNTSNYETNKVAVAGVSGAVQVAAGKYHACALLSSGQVKCWGEGGSGQVGDGASTRRTSPVSVSNLSNALWITAGQFHSCAVRMTGGAVCWGEGGQGQLGHGGTGDKAVPEPVANLSDAAQIAAGKETTCALRNNGRVSCWGTGASGQLGNGTTGNNTLPQPVSGLTDAVMIAVGDAHAVALRINNSAVAWGKNDNGQIGDGTNTQRTTPVAVSNLSNAVYVAAGGMTSCAARSTGQAACWGDSREGSVGDGATSDRWAPTAVSSLTNVSQVACSTRVDEAVFFLPLLGTVAHAHTCAALSNGQYACWGSNYAGEIGNGATSNNSVNSPYTITNVP